VGCEKGKTRRAAGKQKENESPAHYQEIDADIYNDYVGSSDTAID